MEPIVLRARAGADSALGLLDLGAVWPMLRARAGLTLVLRAAGQRLDLRAQVAARWMRDAGAAWLLGEGWMRARGMELVACTAAAAAVWVLLGARLLLLRGCVVR